MFLLLSVSEIEDVKIKALVKFANFVSTLNKNWINWKLKVRSTTLAKDRLEINLNFYRILLYCLLVKRMNFLSVCLLLLAGLCSIALDHFMIDFLPVLDQDVAISDR